MSQHDFDIANDRGVNVRTDMNAALRALASNSLGATEPPNPQPGMWWGDPGSGRLKRRLSDNSAWIDCGPLDQWDVLPKSGGSLAGAINEALSDSVASAASPDIWSGKGNALHITGNAAITGFAAAPQAGARRTLVFDAALTLTQGANLLLPTGANIMTAAGDTCEVLAETKTRFRVVSYQRADGNALVVPVVSSLPAGVVVASAGSAVPSGYLLCDGSTVSRAVYSSLFAAIGTTYGAGDGASSFNIPDLRGVVLRGVDGSRGLDSGRTLGSYQADAIASHGVTVNDPGHSHYLLGALAGTTGGSSLGANIGAINCSGYHTVSSSPDVTNVKTGITASYSGAAETRMKNVAVNYFIKF